MMETTFAMIKPDAVKAKNAGKIIDIIESKGFEIVGLKKMQFSKALAEQFYGVHKERPFFGELVDFITSGPLVVMALKKENAIRDWRALMGETNPEKWEEGTLRKMFGTDMGSNAVHGSDAPETAMQELALIFTEL